jgi:hypothetical protein
MPRGPEDTSKLRIPPRGSSFRGQVAAESGQIDVYFKVQRNIRNSRT